LSGERKRGVREIRALGKLLAIAYLRTQKNFLLDFSGMTFLDTQQHIKSLI